MKLVIPQDWDGTSWECVKVYWPRSDSYTSILTGLITQLMQHRAWDTKTGNVADAQAIGWDIFKRNFPYTPCDECEDNGDRLTIEQIRASGKFGGVTFLGDETVPQGVVTEITFDGATMRVYYGHCCFDEFDLSALIGEGGGIDGGVDPINPDGIPGFVYSACGKATAVVEAVYKTIEAAFSAVTLPFPWQVIPYIEDAVGYDLDNNWLYPLIADVTALTVASISFADVATEIAKQDAICRVVALFDDDNVGVPTSAAFDAIKEEIKAANFGFTPMTELVDIACNAIGRVDMDTIARMSAGDTSHTCDCPPEQIEILPGFGADQDWVHVYDMRQPLPADTVFAGGQERWTLGIGVWGQPQQTDDKTVVYVRFPLVVNTGSATITRMGLVWQTVGDENWEENDFPGLGTEVGPQIITYTTMVGVCGENPSAAGTWQMTKVCSQPITAGEPDFLEAKLSAYHPPDTNAPDEHQYSVKLIAVAFAGMGDDPRP